MKAIYRRRGSQTSFVVEEPDESRLPLPDKCSVVIKVSACAVSPIFEKTSEEWLIKESCLVPAGREVAGVVTLVGCDVTNVSVGDNVVGILPLTSDCTGCAEYCVLQQYDLVKKPEMLSNIEAVGGIGDCVRAYTALHYLGHVSAGDTVLILDGASPAGYVMVQLAQLWGAKVITTASSRNDYTFLERLQPPIAYIVEMTEKTRFMSGAVMEETGGLGVDCIIDNGVQMFSTDDDANITGEQNRLHFLPQKHDLLSCLGVGSKWVTSQPDLQLDPPDSLQLYMRGASVCFLFDPVWTLTRSQHGRYKHILQDAVDKLDRKLIRPKIHKVVTFDETIKNLEILSDVSDSKVVVKMS